MTAGTSPTGTPSRDRLPDGTEVFTKTLAEAPPQFFEREAAGLRALAAAGARVPQVLGVRTDRITLSWVPQGHARTAATEEEFGRELAALHRTTGERYGSVDGEPTAYLGACPVDLTPTDTWAESWVGRRVVPLARRAADEGRLDPDTAALAERIDAGRLGPPEPVHQPLGQVQQRGSLDQGKAVHRPAARQTLTQIAFAAHVLHGQDTIGAVDPQRGHASTSNVAPPSPSGAAASSRSRAAVTGV